MKHGDTTWYFSRIRVFAFVSLGLRHCPKIMHVHRLRCSVHRNYQCSTQKTFSQSQVGQAQQPEFAVTSYTGNANHNEPYHEESYAGGSTRTMYWQVRKYWCSPDRDTANTSHPHVAAGGPQPVISPESPSLEPKRRGGNLWGRHHGRRGHRGWHPSTWHVAAEGHVPSALWWLMVGNGQWYWFAHACNIK